MTRLTAVAIALALATPVMAQDGDHLGLSGLPGRIECSERPDGDGGLDVIFSATRVPDPKSDNGTTTMIMGILHLGRVTGTITEADASGKLTVRAGPEEVLFPIGMACRAALFAVPGIAG